MYIAQVFGSTRNLCTEGGKGAELDAKPRKHLQGSKSNEQLFKPSYFPRGDTTPFVTSATPTNPGYSTIGANKALVYPSYAVSTNEVG
jgi:hypothetical protein